MPGFDPFRDIDRLLGDVTRTPASVAMPMDLYRTGDEFVAHIDLPGVDPAASTSTWTAPPSPSAPSAPRPPRTRAPSG